ncbi:MAG: hypothetical protein QM728_02900 [Gordonia sp. (in: high G+C Gram-positive bacteria)]|uniref:hypothetical protein n=1 Tax=Gordonia sp. (in: high G+C Gram-positive bacteria) TaxID=84139 RepID=UPI0039E7210D
MPVTLDWIPLGAGGRVVARCGRVYEALTARRSHRSTRQLVHAALNIDVDGHRYVIEQAPAWGVPTGERGVVATGPVGFAPLEPIPLFRYEVRCWQDGTIPDLGYAIEQRTISDDPAIARRVLAAARRVPTHTWGRRAPGTSEMWNSNAVVAWVLTSAGLRVADDLVPDGCRAPGWAAGIEAA